MESGIYKGFISVALDLLRKHYPSVHHSNFLPWRVYTDKDLELYRVKSSCKTSKDTFELIDKLTSKKAHISLPPC